MSMIEMEILTLKEFFIPNLLHIFTLSHFHFNYVKTEVMEEINKLLNAEISSATCSQDKGMYS